VTVLINMMCGLQHHFWLWLALILKIRLAGLSPRVFRGRVFARIYVIHKCMALKKVMCGQ
jgi:hypothetical protein